MRVVLFGATGMVGASALIECLADPRVESVLVVRRTPSGVSLPKVTEIVHSDFFDFRPIQARFADCDACFFCLGVSAVGMSEEDYHRLTYDLTLAAARSMLAANAKLTFCYVSGAGTDSTERGHTMWAQVKGKTENALLRLPFKAVYLFRPGAIQPLHGIRSRTLLYRLLYVPLTPLLALLRLLLPNQMLTTESIGQAMLAVARHGAAKQVLEAPDINALGRPTL